MDLSRPISRRARPLLLAALPAALVLTLALLAGCGDEPGTGGSGSTPTASTNPTSLEVDLYPPYGPEVRVGEWTLTCDPAGGTLPTDARAACHALLADPSLLEAPACGGERITDQRSLRVTGTLNGAPVVPARHLGDRRVRRGPGVDLRDPPGAGEPGPLRLAARRGDPSGQALRGGPDRPRTCLGLPHS